MKQCVDWDPKRRPVSANEVLARLCEVYEEVFEQPCKHAELPPTTTLADDWNNRALSYVALGREEDAEKAWQSARQADPRHPESEYNFGVHKWRGAKTTDWPVLVAMRGVIESDPSAWLPRYLLAQVHMERGDAEGAKEELGKINGEGTARGEVRRAQQTIEDMVAPSRLSGTLGGRGDGLLSVYLGVDGRYALSGDSYNRLALWEVESGRCLRKFEGHTSSVISVSGPSADGQYALSGSEDQTARLWKVDSGRCLRTFEKHPFYVTSVCLSSDARLALSGSLHTVMLWEVASGRCLRTFEGNHGFVKSVCLNNDGRYALSGSDNRTLKLWEVASGRCLRTFEGHTQSVISVCLSADGRYALSGSDDRTLKLWEVASGRCLRTFEGHTQSVISVCLSADGRYALSGSVDQTVRLWEVAGGRCLRTFEGHSDGVKSVCLSGDGRLAMSLGGGGGPLKLWEVGTFQYRPGLRLSRPIERAEARAADLRYEVTLSNARMASATGDALGACRYLRRVRQENHRPRDAAAASEWAGLYRRLRLRGLADCWQLWSVKLRHPVQSVCLSGDGRLAMSGSDGTPLNLWDVASGRCVRTFEYYARDVDSACFSADGRFVLTGGKLALAFAGASTALKLWNVENGRCLRMFGGHTSFVRSVCLSVDGRYALSGSLDHTLKLWEVGSGRCLRTFEGHNAGVRSVCLSPDGQYALSGSADGTLKLWETSSGSCSRTFEGHDYGSSSVCLSVDGRYALSGSGGGKLRLWELTSGCCLRTFEGHLAVESVGLSSDGRYALSRTDGRNLQLWEVASGHCLRTLEHETNVYSASLSADGQHVLAGCQDGSVVLWFLDWELEENEPADWDEGARPYLDIFLRAHKPCGLPLPQDRHPTDEEVTRALTRHGRPVWSEEDFKGLLYTLGCAGWGWLRSKGVRHELEKMTAEWEDPQ